MEQREVQSVLVVGAGSIGVGVVHSFDSAGFKTSVLSRTPSRLEGKFAHATVVASLPAEPPCLIVESIPEVADLKRQLYAEIEERYAGRTIIATNTSGLPLEDLARPLRFRHNFMGLHYLFPADASEFVELSRIAETSDVAVARVSDALKRCGKTPVVLNRPVIGALINRLQHAILREAYYLIAEGIVTPSQIDDIAKRLLGPRMCISGLIEQKDISGLDTHALAQQSIVPHLCHDPRPSALLQQLYAAGHVGLKSGKGFYDWGDSDPLKVKADAAEKVARIMALLAEMDAAGADQPE
ncbi:MAG: 3-hydroxyacyl-CoA dehydrogenase family protein [Betaproteobacteria bacterium]|nr:3-hydroxyacyl-CoA dehydrogenase family protein [Betaproteobacteria bacterium]MBI2292398.1 3-hydroxyacyl-CoA dehydrogenase family protein [Betaproteobacteria bacterium]